MQPLADIKVLDFSKLLPGPLATQLLADMGATIWKIEHPHSPDMTRFYPPVVEDIGVNFLALNRTKTCLSIDYKSEAGRAEILALVAQADVLLEQFRPQVMESLGFGVAAMRALNPRLIYVSLTGYGQTGPYARLAGHDLNYLAESGILSLNTDTDGVPQIPGVQMADVAGGAYMCVSAISAALYARERTGQGTYLDLAMLDGLMPLQSLNYAQMKAGETLPDNNKTYLSGRSANYAVYACADGRYVALAALEPKFWTNFCKLVKHEDWIDRFLPTEENSTYLKAELSTLFKLRTRDEWVQLATGTDCCLSAVRTLNELDQHPQLQARKMFITPSDTKFPSIASPLKF